MLKHCKNPWGEMQLTEEAGTRR